MRVNDHNNLTGASAAEAGRTQEISRADGAAASRTSSSRSGGDRVELSSTSASVSRAMTAHHSDRAAKVQALSEQYQRGNYRPDAVATSRAMVSDALAPSLH
jgi:anti-sigma28 factor (negative regulator of flagellin synthesis)